MFFYLQINVFNIYERHYYVTAAIYLLCCCTR